MRPSEILLSHATALKIDVLDMLWINSEQDGSEFDKHYPNLNLIHIQFYAFLVCFFVAPVFESSDKKYRSL